MAAYPQGSQVKLSWEYKNKESGAYYDPTIPKLTVLPPTGGQIDYAYPDDAEIVKDAVGKYHMNLDASLVGFYRLRAWATGTGAASTGGWSINIVAAI